MPKSDGPSDNSLEAILNDPAAAQRRRRLQQQRQGNRYWRVRIHAQAALHRAAAQLTRPDTFLVALEDRFTDEEHLADWAERLKCWGDCVRACGPPAVDALRDWQPPPDVAVGREKGLAARFAHSMAKHAANPDYTAAAIQTDLRRVWEAKVYLLSELEMSQGWLGSIHGTIIQALEEAWAIEEADPPQQTGTDTGLTFLPGAFVYRGHQEPLSGKPLEVLRALHQARAQTLTLTELRNMIWADSVTGDETIRCAVLAARKALRQAMKAVGVQDPADPIPVVDRGTKRTAWRLNLP
ncbi:MAG: hypothetical protein L0Z62_47335 [Gemmataceae bacterium]|nr:hypothetical protein [Gemmataceae bacterium]